MYMPQCGGCLPRTLAQFYLAELVSLRDFLNRYYLPRYTIVSCDPVHS